MLLLLIVVAVLLFVVCDVGFCCLVCMVGFSGVWYCCCVYVAGFGFLGCLLRRIGGLMWMFCVRGLG